MLVASGLRFGRQSRCGSLCNWPKAVDYRDLMGTARLGMVAFPDIGPAPPPSVSQSLVRIIYASQSVIDVGDRTGHWAGSLKTHHDRKFMPLRVGAGDDTIDALGHILCIGGPVGRIQ